MTFLMRRDATRSGVASNSSRPKVGRARLFCLILIIALAAVNLACIGLSQGGSSLATQSNARLAVSLQAASGQVGVAYNAVASVSGGTAPYSFTFENGTLPPGMGLNGTTGSITGTPTQAGNYQFFLIAADSAGGKGATTVNIVVAASSQTQQPTITISPSSTSIVSQAVQQFTATVTGTSNTEVNWSASAGTISSSGGFTAPKVSSNTSVTVTATSAANSSVKASASVTVTPLPALAITTTTVGDATAGVAYSATLAATGGKSPYAWSVSSGALPSGIQLTPSTGMIAGTTSSTGVFNFTAKVSDSAGSSATQAYSLAVATNTGYDGPAQLPLVYIQTSMSDTPAPGNTITVASGGNLQSALNSANCGDTITLQAGATFSGVFTFPAKSCDNNHWIIVRTSMSDSALPAEGSRLTPCYAGVASLPGRPALNCKSTTNVLAKLVMPLPGPGPIIFATGANHYRLVGLEVTRLPSIGIVYELASIAVNGTANNLILDRMWLHGTAQDETTEGLELIGASYVSVIDSTLTDFHCISVTGSCTDAHAIGGGAQNPVGPFKIVGNFLEASGENVLFGGAQATITPADIQISQNHFFKPLTWMPGQPGFVGGANGNPFIVKNFVELKNAQRVLIEANIMENNWGGFSQDGSGIVITPKNQASGTTNICPICQVTDITVRYNTLSHVGNGLQIANALSDNGGGSPAGERYSLHDLVIDDINPVKYNGPGYLAEVLSAAGTALLQNVSMSHITAFPPSGLFSIGDTTGTKIPNFTFTNSLVTVGTYPIWSTGGGTANCAYYDVPLTTFNACFSPYTFTDNGLIADPSGYPSSSWPSGNFFPATASAVQFTNYNNGNAGNYQLLSGSPYKNAGTDGKDLGADIAGLQSALSGVE
jgi:hypothetical protein